MVHCMKKSQFKDTLTSTYHSSGSRVGEGGMDPLPCRKKVKKIGRERRLHRFHVSRLPDPAAGSAMVL